MNKTLKTILSVGMVLAAALPTAAALRAQAETQENLANAQTKLLAPSSYEQYLPLTAPADVSVTKNHTAIADGNVLYVYDRADDVYRAYEHTQNTAASQNQIVRLQFADADTLYFLDASTNLFTLDVSTMENAGAAATKTDLVCSEFFIDGETLYFTRATTKTHLLKAPLSDLFAQEDFFEDGISSPNALTVWDGELYFTEGGKYLYKFDPHDEHSTPIQLATFSEEIRSMTIIDGVLFCSGKSGLYAYALGGLSLQATENAPFRTTAGDFTRLYAYNDLVYAVSEDGVLAYAAATGEIALEITASSDSPNRLNGSMQVCFADDKLFIADGNARISVYDTVANAFTTAISSPIPPQYLASDGETLLVANASTALLYSLSETDYGQALTIDNPTGYNGKLVDIAAVYGNYYLITDNNYFYALSQTENGWTTSETKKSISVYPKMLSADAYGNLYTVCGNGIYRYDETSFTSSSAEGEKVYDGLPAELQALRVDYQRNFYALYKDGVLPIKATADGYTAEQKLTFDGAFVYGKDLALQAFDFGVKENAAYLLCEGDYLLSTTTLGLPTVKTVPTDNIAKTLFSDSAQPTVLVQTKADALFIEFDLTALQGAEYFPYLAHERQKEPVTALKLGETGGFTILAIPKNGGYKTYIAESAACAPLPETEFYKEYAETERKTLYLSSEAALFAFPCFANELAICPLPRRAQVIALGEIHGEFAYYFVSYTDENGAEKKGYIPKAYANEISGENAPSTEICYGETESDNDSVWRMAYLLLGTFAICILADYLLIRKPKED